MKSYFTRPSKSHGKKPKPILSKRFGEAMCFAVGLHRRQARKDTSIPYSSHLLAVAALVLEHGGTEDQAIAALLHDTIEDQSGRDAGPLKREIRRLFGRKVVQIIEACSDATSSENKPPYKERKRAYIAHLAHVSDAARLVSLADKVHNAQAILRDYKRLGEKLWRRFNGGKEGTLWYYRELSKAFRRKGHSVLAAELEDTIQQLNRLVARQGR
jgi:(p)ppGpp synthase/HD superfamily hydrolase